MTFAISKSPIVTKLSELHKVQPDDAKIIQVVISGHNKVHKYLLRRGNPITSYSWQGSSTFQNQTRLGFLKKGNLCEKMQDAVLPYGNDPFSALIFIYVVYDEAPRINL